MIKFENQQNGRYYYMTVQKDMLDEMVLVVIRGGVRSRVIRRLRCGEGDTIRAEIEKITKKRLKRGYSLVS
jgi:hypothetical protein